MHLLIVIKECNEGIKDIMSHKKDEIDEIIQAYDKLVLGIETTALHTEKRAYGGIIRAGKGKLVESIASHLVSLAWQKLGGEGYRLRIPERQRRINIPIRKEYVESLTNEDVKNFIKKNIDDYYYAQGTDIRVLVEGKLVMIIECKSYTENAMMKRILIDFSLLKRVYPNIVCVLIQLESQLGGDFSDLKQLYGEVTYGSKSTHTLLSHFEVDLMIITLLKGERKVQEPIHKKEFFKPLTKESLNNAIDRISELLKGYVVKKEKDRLNEFFGQI